MAGFIKESDIEEVKRRSNIADLVGEQVALKAAGIDSLKGLCPFHDERTPSFHVRPTLGYFHCFGCGESGDAISFLQKIDHVTFTEAVERLAARINYQLSYEEGAKPRDTTPNRARLLAANSAASEFFQAQLSADEGKAAREFLLQRGFAQDSWQSFQIGYAPRSWNDLSRELQKRGFNQAELLQAGLLTQGKRGPYDRFRGRVIWPIRDTSGQTLGFGARHLFADDSGPKYLNTPETPVYHKSRVLYGLDLAKKAISRNSSAVIVEGYTDVMACHLAGVETAIATCGTAFGAEHISLLRRILGDNSASEVIFTFDPDTAGQKAALKAFSQEQRFTAQTYVAIAPDNLDPADLRLKRGDEALVALFKNKQPLFEFALRSAISRYDLNAVAGRVAALSQAAPIVAQIKDRQLQPAYTRELARMLGMELSEVQVAVRQVPSGARVRQDQQRTPQDQQRTPQTAAYSGQAAPQMHAHSAPQAAAPTQPGIARLPQDPRTCLERDALMAMLQQGSAIGAELLAQAISAHFSCPPLRVINQAIAAAAPKVHDAAWLDTVFAHTPATHQRLVRELAVATMPERDPARLTHYAKQVVISLLERDLQNLKQELLRRLRRVGDSDPNAARQMQEQLMLLEQARRNLHPDE